MNRNIGKTGARLLGAFSASLIAWLWKGWGEPWTGVPMDETFVASLGSAMVVLVEWALVRQPVHTSAPRLRAGRAPSAIVALVLLSGAGGAAAAEVTPPVNLGAAGLDVELRLWKWDGAAWTAVSTEGLVVADLGTGEYTVQGLPAASGADRYSLQVALEGDPARSLASWAYGARPAQRIVWRSQIALPDAPRIFKKGDTHVAIALTIRSGLPAEIGEPETAVAFALWSPTAGVASFTGRPAAVADVVYDEASGSWGATLLYQPLAADLVPGRWLGEFTVCYAVGDCHTLPSDNSFELRVLEDFD